MAGRAQEKRCAVLSGNLCLTSASGDLGSAAEATLPASGQGHIYSLPNPPEELLPLKSLGKMSQRNFSRASLPRCSTTLGGRKSSLLSKLNATRPG